LTGAPEPVVVKPFRRRAPEQLARWRALEKVTIGGRTPVVDVGDGIGRQRAARRGSSRSILKQARAGFTEDLGILATAIIAGAGDRACRRRAPHTLRRFPASDRRRSKP
jgi:hypothetical protein